MNDLRRAESIKVALPEHSPSTHYVLTICSGLYVVEMEINQFNAVNKPH